MNRRILPLLLAVCLTLSGCASLLERSYSVVEPYTDRYWDSGAEDTLKAESYQDLVNSLLMLVEQRAEEGVIRFYVTEDAYNLALAANREVRLETALGSYLLRKLTFSCERTDRYCTLSYEMSYREDAEELGSIMTLSDSQSLVDLLRLAVREEHPKMTAQFVYDTPRDAVISAVESLWQELCLDEQEQAEAGEEAPNEEGEEPSPEEPAAPPEDAEQVLQETQEEPVQLPPCPWEIRFYPDLESAEIVEILLQ